MKSMVYISRTIFIYERCWNGIKRSYFNPTETYAGDTAWFQHDRFGMFIHWGLYALPARHEWVKNHERMNTETYEKYFRHFNPDLYDPA